MIIGIDVGGANLKIVTEHEITIHYCPLWKDTSIQTILNQYNRENTVAAVVMSGELADCFSDKNSGITYIFNEINALFPHAYFYGTDGFFHQEPVRELAAANWLVSADFLRKRYPDAILVDIGSTTTDIIPLGEFNNLRYRTDLTRLQQGFLIYTGILRTPIYAVTDSVHIGMIKTPISSEFFATTADAWLLSGKINENQFTCDTADGAGKTFLDCSRRLARIVCCDLTELTQDQITTMACEIVENQIEFICSSVEKIQKLYPTDTIIIAGIGAPLLYQALDAVPLYKEIGESADALPAFAAREVFIRNR